MARNSPLAPTVSRNSPVGRETIPPRLAYKVVEVAKALGVDRSAVYDLLRTGRLRFTRLAGGTILIPTAALDQYLNGIAS